MRGKPASECRSWKHAERETWPYACGGSREHACVSDAPITGPEVQTALISNLKTPSCNGCTILRVRSEINALSDPPDTGG
mmetsp:Transcript_37589/g.84660  ORF Transcript_37589/g.84660 Transcript_37589/m.84660 type:complete len:80 (+) Transcript_37589:132-371(+)